MKEYECSLFQKNLENSYINLKKISNTITKFYSEITKADIDKNYFRNKGKDIDINIKKFKKILNELKNNLELAKTEPNSNEEEVILTIDKGLLKIQEKINPMITVIEEKINSFSQYYEEDKEYNEERELIDEFVITDLFQNKEYLEKRKKELREIEKTSELIKDLTDRMYEEIDKNAKENEPINSPSNFSVVDKKKINEEIKEKNEITKKTDKKLCFIISFIIIISLAIIFNIFYKKNISD